MSSTSETIIDQDETLFETKSIEEIVAYSRSLARDIDWKREELRTMVGERYRDLMQAAETILSMKETANDVIVSVDKVITKGSDLHSKSLIGFKANSSSLTVHDPGDLNHPYLATAAEIKLLMMAPEKIWSAVDQGDFLTAVQLYTFSRHIHTNLTLPSSDDQGMSTSKVASLHFPVVARQWASISHFYDAILEGCEATLKNSLAKGQDEVKEIVRTMTALVLLKGLSAKDLFNDFLNLRKEELFSRMKNDRLQETAKKLIDGTLNIIRSTIFIIYVAFGQDGTGGLIHVLQDISRPTLQLFETRLSPVFKFLPNIVTEFVPKPPNTIEKLDESDCHALTLAWLDSIHETIVQETAAVLTHVSSIQALSSIRKHCYESLSSNADKLGPKLWQEICQISLGKDLNLWSEYYRELFKEKAEALISSQIAGSVYFLQSSLASGGENNFLDQLDLSQFLWSESNLNEVTSLARHGGTSDHDQEWSSMELKAQGFSPRVQELCKHFDELLGKMISDLTVLLTEKESLSQKKSDAFSFLLPNESAEVESFDLTADNESLLQYLQREISDQVSKLLDYVSKKYLGPQTHQGLLLLLGRLFQAIPDLCKSLEKCFLAPQIMGKKSDYGGMSSFQQRRTAAKTTPSWNDAKSKLEMESCNAFNLLIDGLVDDLGQFLALQLGNDSTQVMKAIPDWENVEISEEAEDGTMVSSRIRVPQHPSVAFICGLSKYCETVYGMAPYSLPVSVQARVSQHPALTVLKVYKDVTSTSSVNQIVALQLHFDVQFVSQCMVTRENKEATVLVQQLTTTLESFIDPFDLRVFAPYMAVNVKRSILRQAGYLSIVIPNDRNALLASMKSSLSSSTTQSDQHNVIWHFKQKPEKLPLIPIPRKQKSSLRHTARASGNVLAPVGNSMTTVSPVLSRRKRDKSPVAKVAGSFFEAMSTSWFGGK